ncbi:MAG: hypothetical protein MI919_24975 [Holophagales bacterium]|nr:hypothetical protein [Holophagales bacterium]
MELLRIAVRLVYPDKILGDGTFQVHICTAFHGLEDLEARDPYLEALAYSALVREIRRQPSPLLRRVSAAAKQAEDLRLTGDESVVLSRAQGVVWGALLGSSELRAALRREHERVGHLLPISIHWAAEASTLDDVPSPDPSR